MLPALACAVALALPASAMGATITPDTFGDDNTTNGNCTLREAIISANGDAAVDACAAGTAADVIPLQPGTYERSVAGADEDAAATGDLDITDPDGLEILGDPLGSTVDAKGIDRVFHTRAAAVARFDLVIITGGNAVGMGVMGGGIDVAEGSNTTVINTTIIGNKAEGEAGGIEVHNLGTTLNLTASTLIGNASTTQEGGGLEYDNNSTANVTNTTFSGNTAGNNGGAIESEGGVGNFLNVTITNNTASNAGGGIVLSQADGQVNLKGTILAGNSATTGTGPDCTTITATPITSQGNNLIGTTAGCTVTAQGSDLIGVDPLLGPLADNGGPTLTHALLPGSPAIDAGPPDAPPTDQRGAPRNPDIGAYELVRCQDAVVNRVGSANDDNLTGTDNPDAFLLLAGNDTATGLGENDLFCGAEGNDAMSGEAGNDFFDGGDGDDVATGGDGDDVALGVAGNDSMNGDAGNDTMHGEVGNDAMSGDAGNDFFDGGDGDDGGTGGDGDDVALGLTGNDTWSGDAGNDRFQGGDGDDVAAGGLGDDKLKGLVGKDRLRGLAGKDRVNGGLGKDQLAGGKGKDTLRGAKAKDTLRGNGGADKINSVDASADKVNCGGGDDRATVDPKDDVSTNCETVHEV